MGRYLPNPYPTDLSLQSYMGEREFFMHPGRWLALLRSASMAQNPTALILREKSNKYGSQTVYIIAK